ncbi:MAG: molybdopterin-binding protein [Desulfobulbales bacterium]|nr:molybdopterin-binding protein [Desulfobulbales bacterium]
MNIKLIPVTDAIGMVLSHDITEIVPGRFKGAAFKRGHIVKEADISRLKDLGKENIAVLKIGAGWVHEDDAARRLAAAASGNGITLSQPSEGKVDLIAATDGLLKINVDILEAVNAFDNIILASLHTNRPVSSGRTVAGTRIIPLTIEDSILGQVEALCMSGGPVVSIQPLFQKKIGVVTTGSEVYHQRIEDKFGPVVEKKIKSLGSSLLRQIYVSDDVEMTIRAINDLVTEGAEIIMITGGMSVDPDDCTPSSIRATGAEVITYGAPVLPGAMFMLAYLKGIPVIGLPGCVMYHEASIFDLVVPRILAGEKLSRRDFVSFGHGGLCARCDTCRFPECGFGV